MTLCPLALPALSARSTATRPLSAAARTKSERSLNPICTTFSGWPHVSYRESRITDLFTGYNWLEKRFFNIVDQFCSLQASITHRELSAYVIPFPTRVVSVKLNAHLKRGCMRESTILGQNVILTSRICLKIGM